MRSFGVVFVLFRPTSTALDNLELVRGGCPTLVVVDNTPEPDLRLHGRLCDEGLHVIANHNSGGLAGAYNRGVAELVGLGCELCFLLDQDSDLEPGFFDRMTAAAEHVASDRFLLGPRIYEIEMDAYLPADVSGPPVAPGLLEVEFVISSGSAVTAAAFAELGPFAEELFIEYVDVEYSLRARRAGIAVYVHPDEVLRQHTGAITRHAGGRVFTTNHVAWRRYYLVRNAAWTSRRYRGGGPRWALGVLRQTLRECVVVLAFETRRLRKIAAILAGAVDGASGRLGRFEDARPRTHRYCTGR